MPLAGEASISGVSSATMSTSCRWRASESGAGQSSLHHAPNGRTLEPKNSAPESRAPAAKSRGASPELGACLVSELHGGPKTTTDEPPASLKTASIDQPTLSESDDSFTAAVISRQSLDAGLMD